MEYQISQSVSVGRWQFWYDLVKISCTFLNIFPLCCFKEGLPEVKGHKRFFEVPKEVLEARADDIYVDDGGKVWCSALDELLFQFLDLFVGTVQTPTSKSTQSKEHWKYFSHKINKKKQINEKYFYINYCFVPWHSVKSFLLQTSWFYLVDAIYLKTSTNIS